MKFLKNILLILGICLILSGCDIESDNMKDINIYTTTYPINYLITSLYGEYSKVYSIYPNGVNLDEYKISNRKLEEYSKSDLFIFNSLDKDRSYAVKMINNNSNLKVIDVSTGMNYSNGVEELWLNPYNYLMMAENIKNGLSEYINNPYLIEEINKNYDKLSLDISKIDADLTESIGNAKYKTIIVDNDLFKFLEKYGLTVISLEENDNISLNKIEEVKKLIANKSIKYIYSTKKTSNTTVNNLIKNTGIELITINDMHSIDGGINNTNDNYLTVMKNNINLIENELYK
jgi:zinc transport system substrate-binding protein